MFDSAHVAGLIAGGCTRTPCPTPTSSSFTTHKTLRGPRGGAIVCREEYAKKIDSAVFPGQQGGPLEHAIAAKAVSFKEAAAAELRDATPTRSSRTRRPSAPRSRRRASATSRAAPRTTWCSLDLREFDEELTGKAAQEVLDRAGITTNRNTIPDDPRSPFVTSGLRLGSAAETTAGMKEGEFEIDRDADVARASPPRRRGDRGRGARRRRRDVRDVQPLRQLHEVVDAQHPLVRRHHRRGNGRDVGGERSGEEDLAARSATPRRRTNERSTRSPRPTAAGAAMLVGFCVALMVAMAIPTLRNDHPLLARDDRRPARGRRDLRRGRAR